MTKVQPICFLVKSVIMSHNSFKLILQLTFDKYFIVCEEGQNVCPEIKLCF